MSTSFNSTKILKSRSHILKFLTRDTNRVIINSWLELGLKYMLGNGYMLCKFNKEHYFILLIVNFFSSLKRGKRELYWEANFIHGQCIIVVLWGCIYPHRIIVWVQHHTCAEHNKWMMCKPTGIQFKSRGGSHIWVNHNINHWNISQILNRN